MRKQLILIVIGAVLFSSCSFNDAAPDMSDLSNSGTGGSLACFTIVGNYLYTVDNHQLKVVDVSNPSQPVYKKTVHPGFDIETLFSHGDKLFVGSMLGMYIFDLSENPETPKQLSYYQHIVSCDPVVADEHFAYVTLNSSQQVCWRAVNELQIVDISDLNQPKMIFNTPMKSPQGLSVSNDTLYVCDDGLKIFKLAPDRKNVSLLQKFDITATDVIKIDKSLLVIGNDGFYQYQINHNNIQLLSSIKTDVQ